MVNYELKQLKFERTLIEALLKKEVQSNFNVKIFYEFLIPYFDQIDSMNTYQPIGRIRLERFLLESDLAKNKELFNCYGRFANLVEGISV